MTDNQHIIVERPREGDSLPLWFAILDVSAHWCSWKLIKSEVLHSDGTPAHYGECDWPECTDVEKAQPTLSGYIKWDGCMEFRVGDDGEDRGQVHVCDGPRSVLEIFSAWNWLLTEAHKAMSQARDGVTLYWDPLEWPLSPPQLSGEVSS